MMVAENLKNQALEERIAQLEEQLREAQTKLRAQNENNSENAVNFADTENIGVWTWHPEENKMFWDRTMHKIIGTNPDTYSVTPESFLDHIYPADRVAIEKIIRSALRKDEDYTVNYRMVRENGAVVRVSSKAEIFRDEDGHALRVFGICANAQNVDNHEITLQRNQNDEAVIVVKGISEDTYQELAQKKKKYKKMWQENKQAIQEIKQERDKLHMTGRELQDRNFELDQLIHKISMDVKAPLASVLGLVNLITMEDEVDKIKEYAKLIENRVLKLDNFMMSILNFSKANRRKMKFQRIDFQKLINQCLTELKYLKNYKDIQKRIELDAENEPFVCDALRLRIILGNILANSIRYQKSYTEGNLVTIHVKTTPDEALITITDNGTGINEHYLDKVFEMFVRASEQSDGPGLGLYIVGKVVAKLNGKVELKSREMQETEVKIIIPNQK